jgi:IclR family pca regulon transcriptional regulator
MAEIAPPGRETQLVQSLVRGLSIICAFDEDHPELRLSEVARLTGLTRASARRFLLTLVSLGYVGTDGQRFSLRPKILELGYAYLSSLSLPQIAMPYLEMLVEQVHESSSVSILDGTEVVYVARVPSKRIMRITINVGTRFPAFATSMGRVLLAGQPEEWLEHYLATAFLHAITRRTISDADRLRAELARVRQQGWSLVDQELEEGLRSIAAPIRGPSGRVIAAVNLSAHASRGTTGQLRDELLPPLLATAKLISGGLSAR